MTYLRNPPAPCVVVGFDPCQLNDFNNDLTDAEWDALVGETNAKVYVLRSCYRQKANVGAASRRIMQRIVDSTPYAAVEKIDKFRKEHKRLYDLANDLRFPNPYGYEHTYDPASSANVRHEVARIRSQPLWTHTEPLLFAIDSDADIGSLDWDRVLKHVPFFPVNIESANFGTFLAAKGMEFQHAFVVLSRPLFDDLRNPFKSKTQRGFHMRRLLRIPYSRAKDSISVFVFDRKSEQS